MRIARLKADSALAEILNERIKVVDANNVERGVKAYRQSKLPNERLEEDYIVVSQNGPIRATTYPAGLFTGNLAIWIYSKTGNKGVVRTERMERIAEQIEDALQAHKSDTDYVFSLDLGNLIVGPTAIVGTGYATLVINAEWRSKQ